VLWKLWFYNISKGRCHVGPSGYHYHVNWGGGGGKPLLQKDDAKLVFFLDGWVFPILYGRKMFSSFHSLMKMGGHDKYTGRFP